MIKPHKLCELWHWRALKRWRVAAKLQELARFWAFSSDLATGICLTLTPRGQSGWVISITLILSWLGWSSAGNWKKLHGPCTTLRPLLQLQHRETSGQSERCANSRCQTLLTKLPAAWSQNSRLENQSPAVSLVQHCGTQLLLVFCPMELSRACSLGSPVSWPKNSGFAQL